MAQIEKVRSFLAMDTELPPVPALKYATFWRRVAAAAIDFGIVFAVQYMGLQLANWHVGRLENEPFFEMMAGFLVDYVLVGILLLTIFPWLYYAIAESGKHQATPGKRLLGLYVTDTSGKHFSFARVTIKLALQSVIWLTLFCLLAKMDFAGHELNCWSSVVTLTLALFAWTFHNVPHESILAITAAYFLCYVLLIFSEKKQTVFDKLTGRLVVRVSATKVERFRRTFEALKARSQAAL